MAAKTVAEKLQIKPGSKVLALRADAEKRALLEPLPDGAEFTDQLAALDGEASPDVVVMFTEDQASMEALVPRILPRLEKQDPPVRATWIAFLKGGRSDIGRDIIASYVGKLGWEPNFNVAIDDAWSALRIRWMA